VGFLVQSSCCCGGTACVHRGLRLPGYGRNESINQSINQSWGQLAAKHADAGAEYRNGNAEARIYGVTSLNVLSYLLGGFAAPIRMPVSP